MKVMVFDVGGTAIKYSVMDEKLHRYLEGEYPTPLQDQASFLQVLQSLYLTYGDGTDGIAVSLPGIVDSERGCCRTGGRLSFNSGQPVARQLSELCGCKVYLENDGKCAAIAELWRGSLRGCRDAAVFLIGTGVAGGLILNGQLHRGKNFSAGEFSFLNVESNKWEDMDATLARHCSTTGLIRRYKRLKGLPDTAHVDGRMVFDAVHAGDICAQAALSAFSRDVAIQIYNLTMLLDLERVAVGGGISRQDILLEKIVQQMDTLYETNPLNNFNKDIPRCEVVRCTFGSEANQIGALYHYLQRKAV